MAEATKTTTTTSRQDPVELADSILDRLSIARCLLLQETVTCRLSLVLRILNTTCDDVAELAGERVEQERRDREAEALAKAAAPVRRRRRGILERVDSAIALGVIGAAVAFAGGWIAYSIGYRAGFWS